MERDIKDYLHLYLGCRMEKSNGDITYPILLSVKRDFAYISEYDFTTPNCDSVFTRPEMWVSVTFLKPILRPLSDMTEEVLTEIFDKCYTCVYSNQRDFPVEFVRHGEDNGIKAFDGKYNYGLTVNVTGILFSVDGAFLTYPVFEITRILLQNGYDLFNLIPDGLAIDATTISKPV